MDHSNNITLWGLAVSTVVAMGGGLTWVRKQVNQALYRPDGKPIYRMADDCDKTREGCRSAQASQMAKMDKKLDTLIEHTGDIKSGMAVRDERYKQIQYRVKQLEKSGNGP